MEIYITSYYILIKEKVLSSEKVNNVMSHSGNDRHLVRIFGYYYYIV